MSGEFLGDRRAALEEAFFARQDAELRQRLRQLDDARAKKEALAAASGIKDDAVLEELEALGLDADTVAALSVVPLVAVAWADGHIDDQERRSAFAKAAEMGLTTQSASLKLLEQWLARPPSPKLLTAWKDYIRALTATQSAEARQALKEGVMARARQVAHAAGGFLGLGRKASASETKVLAELEQAFSE